VSGDTLLLLINAHWEELPFTLPIGREGIVWQTLLDTADPDREMATRVRKPGESFPLYGRSVAILRTAQEAHLTEAERRGGDVLWPRKVAEAAGGPIGGMGKNTLQR
jgi:hypothetical protein